MKISDIKKIEEIVQKQFTDNLNRRLSACFRYLRKQKRFDLRGDYPLITEILIAVYSLGIMPSRDEINHMLNQSEEFKNEPKGRKTELLNQLVKLSSVVSKEPKFVREQKKKEKMSNTSTPKGDK
jgi:hypothetical protein